MKKSSQFQGIDSTLFFPLKEAHHLDLDFYDKFYKPGSYLRSHARHMAHWHPEG